MPFEDFTTLHFPFLNLLNLVPVSPKTEESLLGSDLVPFPLRIPLTMIPINLSEPLLDLLFETP